MERIDYILAGNEPPIGKAILWLDTKHSSIYSLDKEELRITSQEGSREYKFRL